MSWIQENKFTAALAGATIVGSGALLALASQKSGEYDVASKALKKALTEEASIQGVTPYPNGDNLEAKQANVESYIASAEKLKSDFKGYRPSAGDLADFERTEFTKMVGGYRERLNAKFEAANTTLPEGAIYYGFDAYSSKNPLSAATGELRYEMKALEWMFSTLAENSPEALINVVRPKLAVESDVVVKAPKKSRRDRRKNRGKKSKKTQQGEALYDLMPIEFSFRCTEAQLKQFLGDLASSTEYYTAIRAVRVQNERLTAPNDSDVKAPEKVEEFDAGGGFGGFEIEESAEAAAGEAVADELPEVASDSDKTRVLDQILGAEKLNVFIKLDLLVLKEEAPAKK